MKMVTVITKERKLQEGEIVNLIKEPLNPKDSDAIAVEINEEVIGYLANNPKNIHEGTISATMLKEDFNLTAKAKIREFLNVTNGVFYYYSAEVMLEKKKSELEFTLLGGTTTFPGKKELVKAVTSDGRASVSLEIDEDRIIGRYNGIPAGSVKADDETFDILRQYLDDVAEVLVTAQSIDKGQVLCKAVLAPITGKASRRKISIKDVFSRIIEEGIETQEMLDEKLEYLRGNKVPEIAIVSLFESYVKYPEKAVKRIPQKPSNLYIDTSGIVADAISFMNIGDNLMFEGDKGVGKNVLTVTLAWLYARPLYEFSSNSQHSNNSLLGGKTFEVNDITEEESRKSVGQFIGLTKLLRKVFFRGEKVDMEDSALEDARLALMKFFGQKDQKLVFEMSSIIEAMLHGGIIVLDEVNTSVAHVLSIFNSALDERRRIEVTGFGLVEAHKNFMAIGTMNLNYEGTFEMNDATKDRFINIPFPALTSIAPIIQSKLPELSYETVAQANKVYLGLKNAVNAGTLSEQALTIRGFISACKVLNQGVPLKNALIKGVANKVDDKDERKAIIEIIEMQLL